MENKLDKTKSYEKSSNVIRHSCPFYGFEISYDFDAKNCEISGHVMEDGKGDSCALAQIINSNRLYCSMESIKNKPNWMGCEFNTKENREKIGRNLDKIMVFPKELRPANVKSWKGIPLRIWMRHVIDTYC